MSGVRHIPFVPPAVTVRGSSTNHQTLAHRPHEGCAPASRGSGTRITRLRHLQYEGPAPAVRDLRDHHQRVAHKVSDTRAHTFTEARTCNRLIGKHFLSIAEWRPRRSCSAAQHGRTCCRGCADVMPTCRVGAARGALMCCRGCPNATPSTTNVPRALGEGRARVPRMWCRGSPNVTRATCRRVSPRSRM
jgi:hypothetical protein